MYIILILDCFWKNFIFLILHLEKQCAFCKNVCVIKGKNAWQKSSKGKFGSCNYCMSVISVNSLLICSTYSGLKRVKEKIYKVMKFVQWFMTCHDICWLFSKVNCWYYYIIWKLFDIFSWVFYHHVWWLLFIIFLNSGSMICFCDCLNFIKRFFYIELIVL